MEQDGWVRSEWGATEKGRKAKFYSLTSKGEAQLVVERESWERLTKGVSRALRYA
jgi:DNA-binding PadR family transcriptional regulator